MTIDKLIPDTGNDGILLCTVSELRLIYSYNDITVTQWKNINSADNYVNTLLCINVWVQIPFCIS